MGLFGGGNSSSNQQTYNYDQKKNFENDGEVLEFSGNRGQISIMDGGAFQFANDFAAEALETVRASSAQQTDSLAKAVAGFSESVGQVASSGSKDIFKYFSLGAAALAVAFVLRG